MLQHEIFLFAIVFRFWSIVCSQTSSMIHVTAQSFIMNPRQSTVDKKAYQVLISILLYLVPQSLQFLLTSQVPEYQLAMAHTNLTNYKTKFGAACELCNMAYILYKRQTKINDYLHIINYKLCTNL